MNNKLKIPTVIIVFIITFASYAQGGMATKGKLYVHNQSNGNGIALHQNKIFSTDQGILSTARNKGADAQILFSNVSSWEGASNSSHVDGFVKSDHDDAFIFPIGSGGHYKPIASSKPKGIAAAHFSDDSSFDIDESHDGIALLNQSSYWVVLGENPTQLTFSWNENDDVSTLTGEDISKLKIFGFNGSAWKVIESEVEPFSLDSKDSNKNYLETPSDVNLGAISTSKEIVPNSYIAYAIGVSDPSKIKKNTIAASRVASTKTTTSTSVTDEKVLSDIDLSNYRKIKSIHFPFTESKITRYSTNLLQKLASDLEGTNSRIRLVGHADFYGSQDFNYQLGLDRANAVKDMLANAGLSAVEVDIVSNGEYVLEKECENCSTKETLIDRRVDIYVYNNY